MIRRLIASKRSILSGPLGKQQRILGTWEFRLGFDVHSARSILRTPGMESIFVSGSNYFEERRKASFSLAFDGRDGTRSSRTIWSFYSFHVAIDLEQRILYQQSFFVYWGTEKVLSSRHDCHVDRQLINPISGALTLGLSFTVRLHYSFA
ncbi:unnamed protein product [Lupinus luteus]|uniref:Uncharacterized protein n=1 Tax=Lupinus luteus TaxID=3873 RepID=A0AAV1WZY7_LUPLU